MNNFIEGIHNYCDRWCERCTFTARCSSYAIEKRLEEIRNSGGIVNKNTFWAIFDSLFEGTFKKLGDIEGNDNNEPDLFQEMDNFSLEFESSENEPWKNAIENELTEAARSYATEVTKWMQTYENDIECSLSQIDTTVKQNTDSVLNSIEVIMWYKFFIAAKLHRATSHDYDTFIELPVDSDENGSAKIALIAINRSIVGWSIIRSVYKTDQNTTGEFMGRLIAIRRVVEKTFPRAHEFVRPGFDAV
jgi:hypothetical protein